MRVTPWYRSRDRPAEHEHVARLEQNLLHRILALQPAEQESRAVADRQGDHRRTRFQRLRALILVLVQPHPARRGVPVDDAEVGEDVEASGTAGAGGDAGEIRGQRRHRPAVDVRAGVLVGIGPRVPVTPEAQHPHAHRMLAANNRRVETGLARPKLQALRRDGDLFGVRQIPPQVPGARRNLQASRTQLGEHRTTPYVGSTCTSAPTHELHAARRTVEHVAPEHVSGVCYHPRFMTNIQRAFLSLIAGLFTLSMAAPSVQAQGAKPAGASPLAAEIDKLAAAVEPELLEWRRYLHQRPELSNRELETAKYVADRLKSFGLEPKTGVARTGVVAILKGGRPGPGRGAARRHGRVAGSRRGRRPLRQQGLVQVRRAGRRRDACLRARHAHGHPAGDRPHPDESPGSAPRHRHVHLPAGGGRRARERASGRRRTHGQGRRAGRIRRSRPSSACTSSPTSRPGTSPIAAARSWPLRTRSRSSSRDARRMGRCRGAASIRSSWARKS